MFVAVAAAVVVVPSMVLCVCVHCVHGIHCCRQLLVCRQMSIKHATASVAAAAVVLHNDCVTDCRTVVLTSAFSFHVSSVWCEVACRRQPGRGCPCLQVTGIILGALLSVLAVLVSVCLRALTQLSNVCLYLCATCVHVCCCASSFAFCARSRLGCVWQLPVCSQKTKNRLCVWVLHAQVSLQQPGAHATLLLL